jgi:hypothetical protein
MREGVQVTFHHRSQALPKTFHSLVRIIEFPIAHSHQRSRLLRDISILRYSQTLAERSHFLNFEDVAVDSLYNGLEA